MNDNDPSGLAPGTSGQANARRPQCLRCLRPESACLCAWVRPTANEVDVFVLQHPSEAHEAKGTARLLQLGLQRCVLMVGESLNEAIWQTILSAPAANGQPMRNCLLYPDTPSAHPTITAPAAHAPIASTHAQTESSAMEAALSPPWPASTTRLVVLDGTWRKSLKMLHANPALQALPRFALHDSTTGAAAPYRLLRQARQRHQLSTLEATCLALGQLEANTARYAPMLAGLDDFAQAQLARRPVKGLAP